LDFVNCGIVILVVGNAIAVIIIITVRATVIAKTYEWSSVDVTDTSASGDTVFVFDPANTDAGILTITGRESA
jgi:hypothetical protein